MDVTSLSTSAKASVDKLMVSTLQAHKTVNLRADQFIFVIYMQKHFSKLKKKSNLTVNRKPYVHVQIVELSDFLKCD